MSFTEKVRGTYGFHEQTLSDRVYPITNTTTRKLVQNELVIFGGVFGNVIELAGIAGSGKGLVNINPERTIKTEQLASGATFSAGGVVYIVDGTNSAPAGLTHTDNGEKNTPVGLVVEIDPATPQRYVVMRPYVQLASTGTISVIPAPADAVKMITLEVDGDAKTTPIELGLDDIGLNVGDTIIDVIVTGAAVKVGGTVKIGHGDSGDDITNAIPAAAVGTVTHATEIAAGVLTDDGIVITANEAEVRAVIRVLYI